MRYSNSSFAFDLYFVEVTKSRRVEEVDQEQQDHVVQSVFCFCYFSDYLIGIGQFSIVPDLFILAEVTLASACILQH